MLCKVVLCCGVLCCVVLCCGVVCCVVLRRVVSRRVASRRVASCRVVSRRVVSCRVARWGVLRCIVMCSVVMCFVVLRCVALCCAALRFDAARCAALCCGGACALPGGMLSRVALRCVVSYSVALQCVVLWRALLRYVVRYCVDLVLRIWGPQMFSLSAARLHQAVARAVARSCADVSQLLLKLRAPLLAVAICKCLQKLSTSGSDFGNPQRFQVSATLMPQAVARAVVRSCVNASRLQPQLLHAVLSRLVLQLLEKL